MPFMASSKYYCLSILLLCMLHMRSGATAQDVGYSGKEKDALYALKTSFDHPFLNHNWTGTPCYMSQPSTWYGIQCTNFDNVSHVTGIILESLPLNRNINLNAFSNFSELSALSLKNNSLWGDMMDFTLNQKLVLIDLSSNVLHGQISRSLLSLGMLESLLVQDNELQGQIPEFNQSTLKEFNVSTNKLNGSIPMTRALQALGFDSFSGNPGLCGPPSPFACHSSSIEANTTNSADKTPRYRNHSSFYLFLLDAAGLVVVLLLFFLYYKKSRKLKKMMKELVRSKSSSMTNTIEQKDDAGGDRNKIEESSQDHQIMRSDGGGDQDLHKRGKLVFIHPNGVRGVSATDHQVFEMGDLLKASAEGLGKGIFGNSYKAEFVMKNSVAGKQIKQAVVVKRLRDLRPLDSEEFTKQLQLIANLKHPNLLPLLAYYFSKDEKLLLYKYVRNGNLFNRLFGERGADRIAFHWRSRLSVARGVARALEYLHGNATSSVRSSSSGNSSSSSSTAPHGNLKSSNILLDENDGVLVSDYGFASMVALPIAAQRMVSYKSPEYQRTKKVSKESDVWSYGSLLLELLTGKMSACTAPPGVKGIDLSSWVHRAVREEWTAEIFDMEILVNKMACSGMLRLLQIAMSCCDPSPEKRPQMKEVVTEVENIRISESEVDNDDDLLLDQSLTDDSQSITAPPARITK